MLRSITLATLLWIGLGFPAVAAEKVTVFAAASMKEAVEAAAAAHAEAGGGEVIFSFAASSVLAKQIEAGAPADAFISADEEWMVWLAERDLIRPETRRIIAGNELVIAVTPDSAKAVDPQALLLAGRFAMGDPTHVPAGRYAKAALEKLGLWDAVAAKAVSTENVRVALEFLRRGEVNAAIVYTSDLKAAPELAAVYTFPASSHPPIVYPAAATRAGKEAALGFLDFLTSAEGQKIFAAHGLKRVEP